MKKRFIYKKYSYKMAGNNLKIVFDFRIEPNIHFRPQLIIKNVQGGSGGLGILPPWKNSDRVRLGSARNRRCLGSEATLDNLVFHLGLMEIPSYWKTTCAPEIIIEAGYLDKEQIKWWQDLILNGMGQFFYENKLPWQKPRIIAIVDETGSDPVSIETGSDPVSSCLVPVGGGRDSIVTLEKLKQGKKKINAFVVNPTQAAKNVLKIARIKNPVVVERKIDPKLLELNRKGYLNGHTPFTALLSFLSVFCAVLFNYKNIAFSNEKSADEGNVKYLGNMVNHQWSKSSEFERKFKNYCKKYLVKNLNYFSYLRKYTDLEISKMFTKYPKYFQVFSSCNIGQKTGKRWCGKCPKCLFVYLTLYPYLDKKQLLKIFGKDLFKNENLLPIMKSLIGERTHKPFECVGTYQEAMKALRLSFEKAKRSDKMPYLLKMVRP